MSQVVGEVFVTSNLVCGMIRLWKLKNTFYKECDDALRKFDSSYQNESKPKTEMFIINRASIYVSNMNKEMGWWNMETCGSKGSEMGIPDNIGWPRKKTRLTVRCEMLEWISWYLFFEWNCFTSEIKFIGI